MRKHRLLITLVTAVLIVATLDIQLSAAPPPVTHVTHVDQTQPQGIGCIFAILILVIGVVIIWGLWQLCKKIPTPPPPNDGQPTNITAAVMGPPERTVQFQFDPTTLGTNISYIAGGSAQDEVGNVYQIMVSYGLYHADNVKGPWTLEALVTNWLGGNLLISGNQCSVTSLTNQEIALYDTNGNLLAARRWAISNDLNTAMMPKIVMPPMHLPEQFYRLVLLEQ